MPLPLENRKYTYEDYLSWDEDAHIEIIEGVPYYTYGGEIFPGEPVMHAAPIRSHQEISGELFSQLHAFLKGKPYKVYTAPFSVKLNAAHGDNTALEPDIVVVCDKSKLDERGCNGAPDLIIEILSPSTARKERIIKSGQYQKAGVREYWLVDPDTKTVQVCVLQGGLYYVTGYTDAEDAPVTVLPGCTVILRDVFAEYTA